MKKIKRARQEGEPGKREHGREKKSLPVWVMHLGRRMNG
jgi:hypothetical protein